MEKTRSDVIESRKDLAAEASRLQEEVLRAKSRGDERNRKLLGLRLLKVNAKIAALRQKYAGYHGNKASFDALGGEPSMGEILLHLRHIIIRGLKDGSIELSEQDEHWMRVSDCYMRRCMTAEEVSRNPTEAMMHNLSAAGERMNYRLEPTETGG